MLIASSSLRVVLQSFAIVIVTLLQISCKAPASKETAPPNIVLIFTDDQGYGDLSCFGATHVSTPRIDRMALEGAKLTSFYVAAPLCSPSRAALMTGSYPKRVGLATGSRFMVLLSDDEWGLSPTEITIPEILKEKGYATCMLGKWHLGDSPEFLPTRQGFDEYFGLPYSHDIHPHHPRQDFFHFPPLPLHEGETIIGYDPNMDSMTYKITKRAVRFIEDNKDHPFFLYVAHPLPHTPLYVLPSSMEKVADSVKARLALENNNVDYATRRELFPEAINEIDWSVGEILDALKKQGLDDNTLVIFTTDNGPHIGNAGPLRGKKGSTYEGGMRVPAVVRWPGHIPAGQEIDALLTSMDLLPTFVHMAGAEVPRDRIIDGIDIWPVLSGQKPAPERDRFFYHKEDTLRAVRSGKWKLHRADATHDVELYDLSEDIGEKNNIAAKQPVIVERLNKMMDDFDREMSDSTKVRPHGIREFKGK